MKRLPRIVERKMLREGAAGQCWRREHLIELDPRLTNKERLEVLIHELLHNYLPTWPEIRIDPLAKAFGSILWRDGYRRIQK